MAARIAKTCTRFNKSCVLDYGVGSLRVISRKIFASNFARFSSDEGSYKGDEKNGRSSDDTNELHQVLSEKEKLILEKDKALDDIKDKYMRALAENENLLTRNKKMVEDTRQYAIQSFSKDLLEVADILEKATESIPKEELNKNMHLKSLFEGLTMTENKLQKVFRSNGLEKIDPIGEKFDPNFHAALFMQSAPGKQPGTVSSVNKIGYKLHGRPLRAALVGVVKD